jgi:hypothetical protein
MARLCDGRELIYFDTGPARHAPRRATGPSGRVAQRLITARYIRGMQRTVFGAVLNG